MAALLFDLDGTMLDTDRMHFAVFRDMLSERGREVDEAFYLSDVHGRINADVFSELFPGEDAEALSQAKEAEFRRRLPRPYPATPGLRDFMKRARAEGLRIAVVTNAMRPNAEAILAATGLGDLVDHVVIAEECPQGKPHPAPYLAAMEHFALSPAACAAFEDSPSGLAAARAAGLDCVGVRSSLGDAALRAAGARFSVEDFTDPALGPLLDRLKGVPA